MLNPKNNFGNVQRKGNHLTVALTLLAILLIHCVGFISPAYHASYTNILFDVVNVVLLAGYANFARKLWVSTFEDYEDKKTVAVILSTVAIVLWVLAWGAAVYTKILNGV